MSYSSVLSALRRTPTISMFRPRHHRRRRSRPRAIRQSWLCLRHRREQKQTQTKRITAYQMVLLCALNFLTKPTLFLFFYFHALSILLLFLSLEAFFSFAEEGKTVTMLAFAC